MGRNNVQKIIIKHLAKSTQYAVTNALREMSADEREEALRIFNAVGLAKKGDVTNEKQ
jgi:hypothetical protein